MPLKISVNVALTCGAAAETAASVANKVFLNFVLILFDIFVLFASTSRVFPKPPAFMPHCTLPQSIARYYMHNGNACPKVENTESDCQVCIQGPRAHQTHGQSNKLQLLQQGKATGKSWTAEQSDDTRAYDGNIKGS
mmetsp:Transcript_93427/g.302476  ORF Transcript_93427/g.302476 Transcript_93427/m.302476 type:complete len:137 (+) Transcript_93427:5245-5655(+)